MTREKKKDVLMQCLNHDIVMTQYYLCSVIELLVAGFAVLV